MDAPLEALGTVNTPLAMLILGARMADIRPKSLLSLNNALVTGIKLVAMPLIALILARALALDPVAAGTLVLSSAMPSAIMSQMLAEQYNRDAVFAAQEVSFTSLVCILTIPLITIVWAFDGDPGYGARPRLRGLAPYLISIQILRLLRPVLVQFIEVWPSAASEAPAARRCQSA